MSLGINLYKKQEKSANKKKPTLKILKMLLLTGLILVKICTLYTCTSLIDITLLLQNTYPPFFLSFLFKILHSLIPPTFSSIFFICLYDFFVGGGSLFFSQEYILVYCHHSRIVKGSNCKQNTFYNVLSSVNRHQPFEVKESTGSLPLGSSKRPKKSQTNFLLPFPNG